VTEDHTLWNKRLCESSQNYKQKQVDATDMTEISRLKSGNPGTMPQWTADGAQPHRAQGTF
jgi:hypothetical protein